MSDLPLVLFTNEHHFQLTSSLYRRLERPLYAIAILLPNIQLPAVYRKHVNTNPSFADITAEAAEARGDCCANMEMSSFDDVGRFPCLILPAPALFRN